MSFKYSKLTPYKRKKIIQCFCLDLTATQCSELLKINRNTINRYYLIFRKAIYKHQQYKLDIFLRGKILNPNIIIKRLFFFPKKQEKKVWKKWFIGIYENEQIIYTNLIKDNIFSRIEQVPSDNYNLQKRYAIYKYNALIQVNQNKFIRLNQNKIFSTPNNIERFWGFSKQRFNKFNGVNNYFELHLKECEWRWKKPIKNMEKELKKLLLISTFFLILSNYFFESNLAQFS
ncbi:MAG: IS1595 family transposase [Flavobacteriaceae bacterium]